MSPSDYREAKGRATGLQASWAMPINMLDAENLLNYAAQHNWFRQILVFALSEKHNHSASIPQLSELTNTTPSTLNRKVKELYHITAARLIRDLRLQYACELLCSSVTITEAALTAGFFDHAHFCHCFKNAFATFPKSVRKEDKHEMPVTWLKNKLLEEIVK